MVESGPAVAYARWCTARSNHKVPRYVKKQAKQFLDIVAGKDVEAHIDERAYARICNLLRIMVHPDIGKSLYDSLEDYAWLLITAVFCVKDNENRRYYNTAVLEIARKNFKTFNAAIIFILLMLTEPQFSRFFSVAPDLKLSSELKLAIRKIIKSSPLLADDGVFRVLRSEIRCKLTDSEYTPLAYSQDRMDGKLANAFLADEAGAMDSYPIEAMRSSQITLKSKLGIIISTQYPNDGNAMIDEIDIAKKTLDGLLDNMSRSRACTGNSISLQMCIHGEMAYIQISLLFHGKLQWMLKLLAKQYLKNRASRTRPKRRACFIKMPRKEGEHHGKE